ncbi:head-tail connector protein [Dinoroseobacter sp. S375]|uniref:head-tail connector protein n=1 Tax=Dinoroseobacter sp. S375 TaxID=3415136 RepID=UPI003C7C4ADF
MLTRVTAPTVFPVTLEEAKTYIRSEYADEDALLTSLIAAACGTVQEMTGRAIGVQEWRYSFPSATGRVVLPLVPVASISSIKYFDADDVEQTATKSDYYLFASDFEAAVKPKSGVSWPATITREDAIQITFEAGTLATPEPLVHAIRLLIGLWEGNRSDATEKQMHDIKYSVEHLTNQYRTGWVAA